MSFRIINRIEAKLANKNKADKDIAEQTEKEIREEIIKQRAEKTPHALCDGVVAAIDNKHNYVGVFAMDRHVYHHTFYDVRDFEDHVSDDIDELIYFNKLDLRLLSFCSHLIHKQTNTDNPALNKMNQIKLDKIDGKIEEIYLDMEQQHKR